MLNHAKAAAPWVLSLGLLMCWTLFIFFPAFPKSIAGWLGLVFVGIPLCFIAEFVGTWVFGSRYAAGWPRWLRITWGIIAMLVLIGLFTPPFLFVQGLIAS